MTEIQIHIRKQLLNLYYKAGCGHIGSSLSCIDIIYSVMSSKNDNEKMILSKGHAAAALYIILNLFGEISDSDLETYYQNGTKLAAHPTADSYPNIPFGLGSLGHGLSIACGIAISNKQKEIHAITYVLMSDGETNEGSTWEALHFAVKNQLDNIIIIIDKNGLQGFDNLTNVLGDTADSKIFNSIGLETIEIDGHNIFSLQKYLFNLRLKKNGKPKILVANTIKGKGVPFMENKIEWHYLPMNNEQYVQAISHLDNLI